MAGEGPDVYCFKPIHQKGFNYNRNYEKVGRIKEVFCDLEPYISKDESINLSEYNETVLNSGVINGKRYFIPIAMMYLFLDG